MSTDPSSMAYALASNPQAPLIPRGYDPMNGIEENMEFMPGPRGEQDLPWNNPHQTPQHDMGQALFGVPNGDLQHMAGDVVPGRFDTSKMSPAAVNSRSSAMPIMKGGSAPQNVVPIAPPGMLDDWAMRLLNRGQ